MGIVNVTPDSFSDGGLYQRSGDAINHGWSLWEAGADIVDVGGESTRPGAEPVGAEAEVDRVVPVIAELAKRGVLVSVDTTKPEVARAALDAGAGVINDVRGFRDPEMVSLAAEAGCGVVVMHMQGEPRTMQEAPHYQDVVAEVGDFLTVNAASLEKAGLAPERIAVDPGIGFGKGHEHNLALLRNISALAETGYPVLVGTSRKSFLGRILPEVEAADRDYATGATLALAIAAGAAVLRVHNVVAASQIARTTDAIVRGNH